VCPECPPHQKIRRRVETSIIPERLFEILPSVLIDQKILKCLAENEEMKTSKYHIKWR
jgi:hypothetical protein